MLVSMMLSISSGVCSMSGLNEYALDPALFIQMSMEPSWSSANWPSALTSSALLTSPGSPTIF